MTNTPRRGRGRPTVFDEPVRTQYLDLIRHGARLGDAATQLGINRVVPARYSKTDREFAAALAEARKLGAKVRREDLPHDEYRYNILKCRCPKCTRAAARGRADRRTAEDPPGGQAPADVHPIRLEGPGVGESLPSFLLARAS
ncbi:hypothetical protein [Streptomyces sp. NPDC048445]|uniref:hypothetical protein n=1 Tax=Streptomyces sp. NPDC048445 TaxID=3365553 RepID=UPI00371E92CB